jgi:hypothetical protein
MNRGNKFASKPFRIILLIVTKKTSHQRAQTIITLLNLSLKRGQRNCSMLNVSSKLNMTDLSVGLADLGIRNLRKH